MTRETGYAKFLKAYVQAMLFAESIGEEAAEQYAREYDTDVPAGDASFESLNYDESDIAPEAMKEIRADCENFAMDHATMIGRNDKWGRAGMDFYLTRNGHGAGFWDGDWPEPDATTLTKASKSYGTQGLYLGDDGKLYVHG